MASEDQVTDEPRTTYDAWKQWPVDDGTSIVATPELERLIAATCEAQRESERLTLRLATAMKTATAIVHPDGRFLCTFRADRPSAYIDWKELKEKYPDVYQALVGAKSRRRRWKFDFGY